MSNGDALSAAQTSNGGNRCTGVTAADVSGQAAHLTNSPGGANQS